MKKSELVRVFVKGGIISPGDFLKVIQTAKALGNSYIHLGSRQDILFPSLRTNSENPIQRLDNMGFPYEFEQDTQQNIVSSYTALDVMPTTQWLASDSYHYILDTFDYQPRLKINLTDPVQNMVPLFTGNLNFVASTKENYWYLYLRFSELESKPWCAPHLFFGFDLAALAKKIEELDPKSGQKNYAKIIQEAIDSLGLATQPIPQELLFPETITPYYEGLNRISGGKYWLGLYWRNNQFTVNFLEALCEHCLKTNIGKLTLTPWKSFIVRGIEEKDRISWEKLLGRWGINIRHSSLELNWHLPVLDEEALRIKNYLVRALDKLDISTYGLSFSVKTRHMIPFTSIVIEKLPKNNLSEPDTFNLLYSKDFNPNQVDYYTFAKSVVLEAIPTLLIDLSVLYYEQLDQKKNKPEKEIDGAKPEMENRIYQCSECLYQYEDSKGDPYSKIIPGTDFLKLPSSYCCPVCEAPKSAFRLR